MTSIVLTFDVVVENHILSSRIAASKLSGIDTESGDKMAMAVGNTVGVIV